MGAITYPYTRRENVVDTYFNTPVDDYYRWLENDQSPATRDWVDAQMATTKAFLAQIPSRDIIHRRLLQINNYKRLVDVPAKCGQSRLLFCRQNRLQDQPMLYVVDRPGQKPRVLINPNSLSTDGTVSLSGYYPSQDGNYLAYTLARKGSDWNELRVRNITTGEDLPDFVQWLKFSNASWAQDGSGFYYTGYDEDQSEVAVPKFQKLRFHKLDTTQAEDVVVYECPELPQAHFIGNVTDDGQYLVINVLTSSSGNNRYYYLELNKDLFTGEVVKLIQNELAKWEFLGSNGSLFWFKTNMKAPRWRVVEIDVDKCNDRAINIQEIIAEVNDPHMSIEDVSLVGQHFFVSYLHNVHSEVHVFDLAGHFVRQVNLPGIGTAVGFAGEFSDTETYYSFTNFTTPPCVYHYDINLGISALYFEPYIPIDDRNHYVTDLVFATSKDGTPIPLFVSYRQGLVLDGSNPTILYGYGGFGISLTPTFASSRTIWMDMGGVYAVAILRGGGEFGEEWHEAGTFLKKQNVFDDFIACAELLIANKYTSTSKLAINGGSNGGLLVGACMTQRPELFGAAIPEVGVLDMLRFDKFTVGEMWTSDYGSASENEVQFKALLAYSPYHNVRPNTCYPPTLVFTADHDDRVVPGHSFKFCAALQWAQSSEAPCLLRIQKDAGHGQGTGLNKQINAIADKYAFLVRMLNIPEENVMRLL